MQQRLIHVVAAVLHQALHSPDLAVAEPIVLQVGEAPIGFAEPRVELEAILVGLLAVGSPAERLVQVPDRQAQPHLLRIQPRRLLECHEGVRLPHEPRAYPAQEHPVLRILRLDLEQAAYGGLGFGKTRQIDQGLGKSSPYQRKTCGLFQCMT